MNSTMSVITKSFFCAAIIILATAMFEAVGQDLSKMEVVYSPPNMDKVKVQQDVVYKTVNGEQLSVDVYYPPVLKEDENRPAVIFASDYPEFGLKDMQPYISWGKLTALNGQIGITYETKQPEIDLADLISYVRDKAEQLNIDKKRIGIWSASANTPVVLSYLSDFEGDFLKFGIFYYGLMSTPDQKYQTEIDSLVPKSGFANPYLNKNDTLPEDLPLFVVRAGQDKKPYIKETIDHFLSRSVSENIPITFINYSEGKHAFDLLNDTPVSRRIIKQTLLFIGDRFSTQDLILRSNQVPKNAAGKSIKKIKC